MRKLIYTENADTEHIIDLDSVLLISVSGKELMIILTLIGGIQLAFTAKDKKLFAGLYEALTDKNTEIRLSFKDFKVDLGGLNLG